MPKGIYLRTEEHRRINSEAHVGVKHSIKTKQQMSLSRRGKIVTEETKKKLRISLIGNTNSEGHQSWNKGKKLSKETKLKMSLFRLGKKFKPMSDQGKKNISIAHLGQIPWNKGLIGFNKGHNVSNETRKKISLANKGQSHGLSGEKHHNWKGGVTKDIFYKRIKNQIRKRKLKDLSLSTVQLVYEDNIKKYGTLTCYLCLEPIEFSQDCLEHKTPVVRGGNSLYENLAIAHRRCNNKKFTKTEKEYREMLCSETKPKQI